MNFDLTEDQAMLKETADKLFADRSGDLWTRMAEMGLLAAPFAEAHGGLDLGPVETMIVAEAAGRAQASCAYGEAVCTAGTAMRLASAPSSDRIAALASGEELVVWAHEEAGRGIEAPRTAVARYSERGFVVSGVKTDVAWATSGGPMVVTVTLEGEPAVLVIGPGASGVAVRTYQLFDGTPAGEVTLDDVLADNLLARGEAAVVLIARALEHRVAWRAAEAVGLMQAMLDATIEHLKTRRQFGEPLSSFQALRHKAADMLIALEQSRSMAMLAALSVDAVEAEGRRTTMKQVRSVVAKAARLVAQTAVQLHGGIGVTEEHPVGRGFRQLTLIDLELERG